MISCQEIQRAISAKLDNEKADVNDTIIEAHLEGCADCRAYLENARLLKAELSVTDDDVPDLTDLILAGVGPEVRRAESRRATSLAIARTLLVLLGIAYIIWAIATLVESTHLVTEGIFSEDPLVSGMMVNLAAARVALGFGLLFASWKTEVATGMLPIFATLWTFSFGFAARDLIVGTLSNGNIVGLLLLLAATLVLVWTWLSGYGRSAVRRAWQAANARPTF